MSGHDDSEFEGSFAVYAGDFQEPFAVFFDRSALDAIHKKNPHAWRALLAVIATDLDDRE